MHSIASPYDPPSLVVTAAQQRRDDICRELCARINAATGRIPMEEAEGIFLSFLDIYSLP